LRRLAQRDALRLVGACADLDGVALSQAMQSRKWEVYIGKPPKSHRPEVYLGQLHLINGI